MHGTYTDEIELLDKRASLAGLSFVSVPIRHMGTERCVDIMRRMRDALLERGVELKMRTPVQAILVDILLILVSLYFDFNLSAVLMEGAWALVAVFGLARLALSGKRVAG